MTRSRRRRWPAQRRPSASRDRRGSSPRRCHDGAPAWRYRTVVPDAASSSSDHDPSNVSEPQPGAIRWPGGKLRFTNRSVVLAVVLLGLTVVALGVFTAATRVIGWILVAALGAGLLHPVLTRVASKLPRGISV